MRDLELASLGSPTIQHTQNLLNEYEISLSTLDVDTMNNRARIFHFISVILKHEPRLSQISPEIFRKLDINPAQQYSNPGPDPAVLNHYRAMKLLSPRTFFSNTHNNTSSNNSLRNQRSAITKSIWDLLGDLGVQPTDVKMGDIITESYVNQLFKKRALCVHPDKNPPEKKMNCESLFHAAKEAAQTLIQNYMHAPIPKFSPTCHLKTAFK
ncbi:MAG TPA: hypothetical protein VHD33_06960 [Legionellaceae bacterium]|nr:hypothetical protein [Legionellaceae bacterium]